MQVYTDFYVNSWIRLIIVAFFSLFQNTFKKTSSTTKSKNLNLDLWLWSSTVDNQINDANDF